MTGVFSTSASTKWTFWMHLLYAWHTSVVCVCLCCVCVCLWCVCVSVLRVCVCAACVCLCCVCVCLCCVCVCLCCVCVSVLRVCVSTYKRMYVHEQGRARCRCLSVHGLRMLPLIHALLCVYLYCTYMNNRSWLSVNDRYLH